MAWSPNLPSFQIFALLKKKKNESIKQTIIKGYRKVKLTCQEAGPEKQVT